MAGRSLDLGPGNRSLLADPRGGDVKDRVNAVKRRQEFRPFAPVIMEEFADEYFEGPAGPSYAVCKHMQTSHSFLLLCI